jgi:hypothetical protein
MKPRIRGDTLVCSNVKRDLVYRQKRPAGKTRCMKPRIRGDTLVCSNVKRDLVYRQKRPAGKTRCMKPRISLRCSGPRLVKGSTITTRWSPPYIYVCICIYVCMYRQSPLAGRPPIYMYAYVYMYVCIDNHHSLVAPLYMCMHMYICMYV